MAIENARAELLDLALELVYAGDAENLTQALAIAADLEQTLAGVALDWNAAVCAVELVANDFDTVFAALPF
jgi:hypothetical protein